jgi:hypothetical protein
MKVKLIEGRTIYSPRFGHFDVVEDEVCSIRIDSGNAVCIYTKIGRPQDNEYCLTAYDFRQALREGSIRIVE